MELIKQIKEQAEVDAVKEFFMKNPNPSDKQVHAFAEDRKIDPHKLEEVIYKLLSSQLNGK